MRPLSKTAISYFLRQLIRAAHEDFPDHLGPTLRVRAHDVRSVATSLLWSTNKAVADVMAVACWRTELVFARMGSSPLDLMWQLAVLSLDICCFVPHPSSL
ncbi:hypothetical protein E2C01_044205 [Portunus trituberculatus]|uniref:Uncharacterized protein n=1 Tax=Portunus trituberculatus TaxID=210409 RepID=A0A5B7FY76_PORTR|nr:hypothetical protein [Portunus trituberculatus]